MTDRDEFAQAALSALVLCHCQSDERYAALREAANKAGRTVAAQLAHTAYEFADAMVKERDAQ